MYHCKLMFLSETVNRPNTSWLIERIVFVKDVLCLKAIFYYSSNDQIHKKEFFPMNLSSKFCLANNQSPFINLWSTRKYSFLKCLKVHCVIRPVGLH